jgi:hypothetical protein
MSKLENGGNKQESIEEAKNKELYEISSIVSQTSSLKYVLSVM